MKYNVEHLSTLCEIQSCILPRILPTIIIVWLFKMFQDTHVWREEEGKGKASWTTSEEKYNGSSINLLFSSSILPNIYHSYIVKLLLYLLHTPVYFHGNYAKLPITRDSVNMFCWRNWEIILLNDFLKWPASSKFWDFTKPVLSITYF